MHRRICDFVDGLWKAIVGGRWREFGSVWKRGKLECARKYRVNQNLAWAVVAEPQGNSVEQFDHDREKRIGDESEVWIGG